MRLTVTNVLKMPFSGTVSIGPLIIYPKIVFVANEPLSLLAPGFDCFMNTDAIYQTDITIYRYSVNVKATCLLNAAIFVDPPMK